MNLQSDNVGFKRPEHSLSPLRIEECEEEKDIISRLPDEILTHIVSLLPDKDAYRTRILSTRWKKLCFLLPSLCFMMPLSYEEQGVEAVNKFYDFVDNIFSFRNRDMPVIKRFVLSCSDDYDHNRVLDWLRIVLHSKHVETLELRFPSDTKRFSLSWGLLMTCNNTLVDLTLEDVKIVALDETQLLFPCLKRVKLESIEYPGDESPQNLISACPVLHELCLNGQGLHSPSHTFKISSPSLKRLRIERLCCKVVIDAPELEYFYIREYGFIKYGFTTCSLTNLSSLVEAHIDIFCDFDIQLLTNVSSAKILTLGKYYVLDLHRNPLLNLPVFPNLVKLIVDFDNIRAWDMLFILLNSMPNLQYITIDFGGHHIPFKRSWNPPTGIPSCLRFMVKEIVILNKDVVQGKDHITLIRYLLKHSSVLEKMKINSQYLDPEKREKLLNLPCCSKIEFV